MDVGLIALIIVVCIRLFLPLTVFRWALLGGVLAILGDICDVMIFEAFGSGPLQGDLYHNFDKFFDTYYLTLEFLVVRKWKNVIARRTAKGLFYWRFTGFALFEILSIFGYVFRPFFLLAPNVFEHFYIFWAFILRFVPKFKLTVKRLIIILLIVGLPKLVQEYFMHFAAQDQTWNFLRDHLFWWIYGLDAPFKK
jgi:hypothetical protein